MSVIPTHKKSTASDFPEKIGDQLNVSKLKRGETTSKLLGVRFLKFILPII
jgi:hypothetical protein